MEQPDSYEALEAQVRDAVAAERYDRVARLLVAGARAMLDGWEPAHVEDLAWLLKRHDQFGYARRLFRQLLENAPSAIYFQQYALCVYRDLNLPASRRYTRALEILSEGAERFGWSGESYGLAGAIHKRRWAAEGRLVHLERAYRAYRTGYDTDPDERGYCGINAAFVLDALADADESGSDGRRQEARDIRTALLNEPLKQDNWVHATLAEAHFGLRDFAAAAEDIDRYLATNPSGWRRESTASQLADLARVLGIGLLDGDGYEPAAARVIQRLVGDAEPLVRRAVLGKVGLALSGGGFRASLFHIGVLARLAERDALRGVEVLSCVSGGSILGAFYYLRVRELLNTNDDDALGRDDYVTLVAKLADDFLKAVQSNPRVELTGDVGDNFRMAMRGDYSRTNRIAELLQEHFYALVEDREWRMSDLLIGPDGFSPRYGNWARGAKVPILILNATTLNTGHSWQFTASTMGEPPDATDERTDANARLARMYYRDAPEPFNTQPPRLADAVAASACVPGLFPPIRIEGLFDGITVELVDGGVHDNQGIASLIEQECATILVSDASGQMGERTAPGRSLLSVASRSNSILMSRVRGAQLADLETRQRAGTLRGLMVVHLKKHLPSKPIEPTSSPDPYSLQREELAVARQTGAQVYKIVEHVQRALADIRTDLDSFSDIEAYALMAAGYRMACVELDAALGDRLATPELADWCFKPMLDRLEKPDRELQLELAVGKERFGKWFRRWWRQRSSGSGKMGGIMDAATHNAKRAGRLAVWPVRAVVAAPAAVVGAAATRVYLSTLGRIKR